MPAVETVLALLVAAQAAATIRYDAPGCVVIGHPARIGLCSAPDMRAGRLHFRDAASPHWYYVEMTRDGGCLWGTLPSAQKRVRRIAYILELTGPTGPNARTPERLLRVVDGADACPNPPVAPVDVADPAYVTATAGAPLTPEGFGESGGNAVPWLAGVLVAGGAAGTAVAVAAAGGEAAAPRLPDPSTPVPTEVPPPLPTATPPPTLPPPGPPPPVPTPTPTPEPPPDEPPPPPTAAPTATPQPTATSAPTATPTPRPGATATPTAEPTATPGPRATSTPTPRTTPAPTETPAPRATATPEPSPTATPTPGSTATPSPTAAPTPTPTTAPTSTPMPSATATPTPPATPFAEEGDSAEALSVSWRSQLSVPGAYARVIVNGRLIAEGTDAVLDRQFTAVRGENRVEIELVRAQGPGGGVVLLAGRGLTASSLRVTGGTASVVSPGSFLVRFRGQPGERLSLVFRSGP